MSSNLPPETQLVVASQKSERRRSLDVASFFARFGTILAFVIVFLIFTIARPNVFPAWDNLRSIVELQSVLFIVAGVLTLPLIMGDFDLSVAANTQLMGAFVIVSMATWGLSPWLSVPLTLIVGTLIGLAVGLVVAYSKLSAFVLTLGAATIFLGFEMWISGGQSIFDKIPGGYSRIATAAILGVKLPVWLTLVLFLVLWFITEHAVLGRYMAVIGGNTEAARLSGINVEISRTIGFGIVGFGAAVAGIVLTAQASQYYPNSATGLLLPAYAGCFIGAATLRPGVFHVWGTYFGVLFAAMIQTGLILMNYRAFTANLIQGAVLIVAVLLSRVGGKSL